VKISKQMEETMAESVPMPMCPMAETCKGMMKKPLGGFALIIPGIILVILDARVSLVAKNKPCPG
jgi:hypothetical protein